MDIAPVIGEFVLDESIFSKYCSLWRTTKKTGRLGRAVRFSSEFQSLALNYARLDFRNAIVDYYTL